MEFVNRPGFTLTQALAPDSSTKDQAPQGSWDSLHVFECAERGRSAKYKLTSTVMLVLNTATASRPEVKGLDGELDGRGGVTLSGSMTRQVSCDDSANILQHSGSNAVGRAHQSE